LRSRIPFAAEDAGDLWLKTLETSEWHLQAPKLRPSPVMRVMAKAAAPAYD